MTHRYLNIDYSAEGEGMQGEWPMRMKQTDSDMKMTGENIKLI